MQYADVAVATRLGQAERVFTYAIPPALLIDLKPGVMVDVPFRARHAVGVITNLRSRLPQEKLKGQLRTIHRLLFPWPLFGAHERVLRARLSAATGSSVSLTATLQLPPPALCRALPAPIGEQTGVGRIDYWLADPARSLKVMVPRLTAGARTGQTALVIAATKALTHEIADRLRPLLPPAIPLAYFHADLPARDRQLAWQLALAGGGVIVGTRGACLLPIRRPAIIWLVEPTDRQLREDQTPHYDAFQVCNLRRELFGATLVVTGSLPPLELLAGPLRRAAAIRSLPAARPQLVIVRRQHGGGVSPAGERLIEESARRGERVLIVVPARGWAAGLVCGECGALLRCRRCGRLLRVIRTATQLDCGLCGLPADASRCPDCRHPNLRSFGWGSDRWRDELATRFPQLAVAQTDREPLPADWQLLVTVPEQLARSLITAESIIAIEPERQLLSNDFRSHEMFLRLLLLLKQRAMRTLLIETDLPDNPGLRELGRDLPRQALREELALRRRHGYPPFGRILTIATPRQPEQFLKKLSEILPPNAIIGPSRGHDRRGRERSELLVKLPARDPSSALLETIRRLLPRGTRWKIE